MKAVVFFATLLALSFSMDIHMKILMEDPETVQKWE
jgi:hypothetical protein